LQVPDASGAHRAARIVGREIETVPPPT